MSNVSERTWRVDYALHAAGGRLWPTSAIVRASSRTDAIERARAYQRFIDREAGRASRGYFDDASAVIVDA